MHKSRREKKIGAKTGMVGKTAVMGLLECHGEDGHSKVRAKVVPNTKRRTLAPEVHQNVVAGSEVFTDALSSYSELSEAYAHQVIDHAECYVKGKVHTNGLENFWSLLKRSIKGTYVSVEPFHLFRYLDEQTFRFNTRKVKDGARSLHPLLATSASGSPTRPSRARRFLLRDAKREGRGRRRDGAGEP